MTGHKIVSDGKGGIRIEDYGLDGSIEYTDLDKEDVIQIFKVGLQCAKEACKHYDEEKWSTDGCPYECCIRGGHDYFEPKE